MNWLNSLRSSVPIPAGMETTIVLSGYFIMKSVRSIHPSCIRRFALSVGIRSENMRDTSGFRVSPSTKVTGNLHFTSQSRNMEHVQLFPTPPLSPWKRMTDFEVTVDFLEPVILVYPLVSMTNYSFEDISTKSLLDLPLVGTTILPNALSKWICFLVNCPHNGFLDTYKT